MFPAKSDSKIFCHVSSTFVNSDTSIPNADVANLRVKGYLSKDTFSNKFELFSNSIMKRNYLFFRRQKLSLPQASSKFDLRKINGAYLCLIKDMMTLQPRAFANLAIGKQVSNVWSSAVSNHHSINWYSSALLVGKLFS